MARGTSGYINLAEGIGFIRGDKVSINKLKYARQISPMQKYGKAWEALPSSFLLTPLA
jgi:hypothetical protein